MKQSGTNLSDHTKAEPRPAIKVINKLVSDQKDNLLLSTDAHGKTLLHEISKASPSLEDLYELRKSRVLDTFNGPDFRSLVVNLRIQIMDKEDEKKEGPTEGEEDSPNPNSSNIFTVTNLSKKHFFIGLIEEDKENNRLSLHSEDSTEESKPFECLLLQVRKKYVINFHKTKKFQLTLLTKDGRDVLTEPYKVPPKYVRNKEIVFDDFLSLECKGKITNLYIKEDFQGVIRSPNIKELPDVYKDLFSQDGSDLLITGSIKSETWDVIKKQDFVFILHDLFGAKPDEEEHYCYVFTSPTDEGDKNFALAKLDGRAMSEMEIGEAASYIRRMYTGMYEDMEKLFVDDNDTFMRKLDANTDMLTKVYPSWRAREYVTTQWFYNDLKHDTFKEVIFSSAKGGTTLTDRFRCKFEKYEAGSGKWPPASVHKEKRVQDQNAGEKDANKNKMQKETTTLNSLVQTEKKLQSELNDKVLEQHQQKLEGEEKSTLQQSTMQEKLETLSHFLQKKQHEIDELKNTLNSQVEAQKKLQNEVNVKFLEQQKKHEEKISLLEQSIKEMQEKFELRSHLHQREQNKKWIVGFGKWIVGLGLGLLGTSVLRHHQDQVVEHLIRC